MIVAQTHTIQSLVDEKEQNMHPVVEASTAFKKIGEKRTMGRGMRVG